MEHYLLLNLWQLLFYISSLIDIKMLTNSRSCEKWSFFSTFLPRENLFQVSQGTALYISFRSNSETFCINYFQLFDNISTLINLLANKWFWHNDSKLSYEAWYCARFRGYSLFSYLFLSTQCIAICRSQMQLSPLFFDNCKIARNSLKRNDEGYTREKLDLSSVISL